MLSKPYVLTFCTIDHFKNMISHFIFKIGVTTCCESHFLL